MLLLTQTAVGQTVRLIDIAAGKTVRHRLTELGLTPGVALTLVQDNGGPLLVAVRESRVALGRGTAEKIWVEKMGD